MVAKDIGELAGAAITVGLGLAVARGISDVFKDDIKREKKAIKKKGGDFRFLD